MNDYKSIVEQKETPFGIGLFKVEYEGKEKEPYCKIISIDPVFENLIGIEGKFIENKDLSEVKINENGLFRWDSYFISVVNSGKTQETTQWIEGLGRYHRITVIPNGDKFVVILRDVSEKVDSIEKKSYKDFVFEDYSTLFDRTQDAMLLIEYVSGEFIFVKNNKNHKVLTGYNDVEGHTPIGLLGQEIGSTLINYYKKSLESGSKISYEQKYTFSGSDRIWKTEITPVYGKDGDYYLISSSRDVTDYKEIQKENRILDKRIKAMFNKHAAVMLIIHPFSGVIVDANPAACMFYGYSKDELKNMPINKINVLPDNDVNEYRKLSYENEKNKFIFPHKLKDGDIKMVDVFSCPISDGNNTLLYSIIFDVTDREKFRLELIREKEILLTTLKSIGEGVVTTDDQGIITSLSDVGQEITGWYGDEVIGVKFSEVFNLKEDETGSKIEDPVDLMLKNGNYKNFPKKNNLVNRSGIEIPLESRIAPIIDKFNKVIGTIMVFRDVSLEREHNSQIEFLNSHDTLTGLYNRNYVEKLIKEIDIENNLPISVIIGDVNGLKIVNNIFGHDKGDTILKNMADSIKKNCKDTDLIARWGGDEMIVILTNTNLASAEKLITSMKTDYNLLEKDRTLTSISFGCSVKERVYESIHEVMKDAEEYMYHQKLLDEKSFRNGIINTLLATLYEKSSETEEHSKRLEYFCHEIGKKLNLTSKEMDELSLLAVLHDIGKVNINPNILLKAGPLDPGEWEEMRLHPETGYRIAKASPELSGISEYILAHHERWDGKGYPRGLKADEIPLPCRILSVTDAYDAMTNNRVYRKALSKTEAIEEIMRNSGSQFDPEITQIFLDLLTEN